MAWSPLVTVREWKIGNYEVKHFLIILCLNDSRKRNDGVSFVLYNESTLIQKFYLLLGWQFLRKLLFHFSLAFPGRGCILPMRRGILSLTHYLNSYHETRHTLTPNKPVLDVNMRPFQSITPHFLRFRSSRSIASVSA